jgi:hypothetical protein
LPSHVTIHMTAPGTDRKRLNRSEIAALGIRTTLQLLLF